MLNILKYIIRNNSFIKIPKYLVLGLFFQVFKRVSKKVISKKIFNGKNIFLFPKCNVSSMYAYTDIPDKKEINILRKLAKKANSIVFLDIGANIGSYSVSMMDVCNEIVAFEPHPYTANRCKMNFLLNGFSESNVKQLALSNYTGEVKFTDLGDSSTTNHIITDKNADGIEVEVTTLDDFIVNNYTEEKQYLLKVDVEGYEKEVFEGGKNFFNNYDIIGIIFECFSEKNVVELLNSYDFINIKKISENNYFATKN